MIESVGNIDVVGAVEGYGRWIPKGLGVGTETVFSDEATLIVNHNQPIPPAVSDDDIQRPVHSNRGRPAEALENLHRRRE
jgi:hypothetical protein